MKRIIICLIALTLLSACSANAKPTATQAVPASIKPQPEPAEKEKRAEPAENGTEASAAETPQPEPVGNAEKTALKEQDGVPAADAPAPVMDAPTAPPERFPGKFSDTPQLSERSYKSSSVDITVTTHTVRDTYSKLTTYHVADIYVKDATSIRTAAGRSFDTRYERTVKEIASDAGALLAIDGDTYTHAKKSFIIRNGVLYRTTPIENTDICILYRDGRMETKTWGTFTMQEVIDADPWQVWGFGPALLDADGHAMEIEHRLSSWNPRAAIGYYEPGHYCFVIVDGRQEGWSEGVRLTALSRLMEDLGCKVAYNLDGGASAQMYWNGAIISKSPNEGRTVSDIIYILPEP